MNRYRIIVTKQEHHGTYTKNWLWVKFLVPKKKKNNGIFFSGFVGAKVEKVISEIIGSNKEDFNRFFILEYDKLFWWFIKFSTTVNSEASDQAMN